MKKVLIVLSALMLVHTSSVRAIAIGDIAAKAGDLVSIVPSMIGNGQAIVEGSKELPNVIGEQFTIAKKMQTASQKASSEESKQALLLGATFHIYDATQELAKFVASCGGFVKDLGNLAGVFGSGVVVDKAREFGDNITSPVDSLMSVLEQMKEQLVVMGGDPDATLSKADADKDKAEREKEKTAPAVKQVVAKPVDTKMSAGDYAKAALQMLPIIIKLVNQSITLINSGSSLPKNIQQKLTRLNIKMANLKKAKEAAKLTGEDDHAKAIALSINFDLLDIANMLGVFCVNAGNAIQSLGDLAKTVKQTVIATRASTLGLKIKAQASVLSSLVTTVEKEMKALGADPETGMKEAAAQQAAAAPEAPEAPPVEETADALEA